MSHLVGSVTKGTLADLVLWKPESFGARPEMVIKGGVIAWAQVSVAVVYPLATPFSDTSRARISPGLVLRPVWPRLKAIADGQRWETRTLRSLPSSLYLGDPCGVLSRLQRLSTLSSGSARYPSITVSCQFLFSCISRFPSLSSLRDKEDKSVVGT
jgi:hypothetical protein